MSKDNDFRSKFSSTAEVLQKLLEGQNGPVSDQYLRWRLWLDWSTVVGPTVAQNAEPVSYKNGVLWLWVPNSAWLHQMQFMTENIKNAINVKFRQGFVQEIKLTTDKRNLPSRENQDFSKNLNRFIAKK